uniref:Uncharacterized protein n=1 Tax=Plectus sambesii TaxID=2011161 RepID=A0A914XMK1_9BILA
MSRSRTLTATSGRLHTAPRVPPVFRWAQTAAQRAIGRCAPEPLPAPPPPPPPPASCQLHRSVTDGFSRPSLTTCSRAVSAFDGRNSAVDYAPFDHPSKQLPGVRRPYLCRRGLGQMLLDK